MGLRTTGEHNNIIENLKKSPVYSGSIKGYGLVLSKYWR